MIKEVKLNKCDLEKYNRLIDSSFYEEIHKLSGELQGKKIIHINATASGGGVAEILSTLIPLMSCVGISARWFFLKKHYKFFELTKEIHNFLQGKKGNLTKEQKDYFLETNKEIAEEMEGLETDIWVIHDPQPVAALSFINNPKPSVWRSHIDTSKTNKEVWEWLLPYLKNFDRYIFSMRRYIGDGLDYKKCRVIKPAIDPLNQKNFYINPVFAKQIVVKFGIDTERPLISQISRFDPWKDPWGVIDAYRIVKKKFPNLQLALLGAFSLDDPEAHEIMEDLRKYAGGDKDIHLLSNLDGVQALEVNAFQRVSDVIVQKSIREGFGLTVSEALWKEKPVVGGKAGGIVEQIDDGVNGFLVTTAKETADRVIQLLEDDKLTKRMGAKGKETVRQKFLLPRLLYDHLKIYKELLTDKS